MDNQLDRKSVRTNGEVPLSEVVEADVERMDGVLSPTNGIPFLLMRSVGAQDDEVDFLDYFLRAKQLERSAAASGTKKQRMGSKHKLMVGGQEKFPINDCSDVQDAWGLRGHAKGVSQEKVESYIKSAASAEGCPVPGSGDVKRYGKTISAATASRIRESLASLHGLLEDTNQNPDDIPEEGVEMNTETQNKAGDRSPATEKDSTKGPNNIPEPRQSAGGSAVRRADGKQKPPADAEDEAADQEEPQDVQRARQLIAKYEREQSPRVGTLNNPSMGGTGSGGSIGGRVTNLDESTGDGEIGTGGSVADLHAPQQELVDGEGNMKAAVAKTAANVKLATSEEESSDIGQQIARSIAGSIGQALGEALKPIKDTLDKIAKEDSRGQQKPVLRGGGGPGSDYLLVRRDDGSAEVTSDSAALQRALQNLPPVERDLVSRELAKNAHPLNRQQ